MAAIRKTMMTAAVVADRVTAAKLAQAAAAAETPPRRSTRVAAPSVASPPARVQPPQSRYPSRCSSGIYSTNVRGVSSNQETTTAVLPPAAAVSVEAVAAVKVPASAQAAAAAVQAITSVQASSAVSMLFFVRFFLSELIYTNSYYLLCSVFIPFRIYKLV